MEILRFDSLSFAYPNAKHRTLDSVSLTMEAGEYVVLCGPSGCGKTTLLRHAKPSLAPAGAREGTVRYNGKPLAELPADTAAAEIGFIQQNPDNQIVTDFVWHELAFGLENLALPVPVIRRRVAEMAAFFGMEPWFRQKTCELSGGQKQLLNMASALAMNPKILILDMFGSKVGKHRVKTLSGKAKKAYRKIPASDRLTKADLEQGSVTVSNIGSIYREQHGATALLEIVPPQIFAVAVGALQEKPGVYTDQNGVKQIGIRQVMPLCLAFDHRAVDFEALVPFMRSMDRLFAHPSIIHQW